MGSSVRARLLLILIPSAALAACSAPAREASTGAAQPKVVVEGRVVGQSDTEGTLLFLARVRDAETLAGPRAVERLVEREPDRAAAAIESRAADSFSPLLRTCFEGGIGPRWRALSASVAELERSGPQADPLHWGAVLDEALALRDPALLARVAERAPRTADPSRVQLAWRRVGEWQLERRANGEAVLAVRRAAALAGAAPDPNLTWIEARAARALGQRGRALELLGELDGCTDVAIRNQALALRGVIAAETGDFVDARRWLERALADGDAWNGAARARHDLAGILFQLGDETGGGVELGRAAELARAGGDHATEANALRIEAAWRATRGEREASEQLLARWRELVTRHGITDG
jgi:tetratricopeptide (TPR) repeat protein